MAGEKVLVVEDNPVNLELVTVLLELAGYAVICAKDAEEGIALVRRERPAVVLMDIGLPGIDGLEATKILKADPEVGDIPVVALTAYAMSKDEEMTKSVGCSGYLTKPINTRDFADQVARFIEG